MQSYNAFSFFIFRSEAQRVFRMSGSDTEIRNACHCFVHEDGGMPCVCSCVSFRDVFRIPLLYDIIVGLCMLTMFIVVVRSGRTSVRTGPIASWGTACEKRELWSCETSPDLISIARGGRQRQEKQGHEKITAWRNQQQHVATTTLEAL